MRQGGRRPQVPPSLAGVSLDRVRRKLFKAGGNVTQAAKALRVRSADLRQLTQRNPTLLMDALEQEHRRIDKAVGLLDEALVGAHAERAMRAAMFILSHSRAARERGWSQAGERRDAEVRQPIVAMQWVQWADGTQLGWDRGREPNVPEARRSAEALTDSDRIH